MQALQPGFLTIIRDTDAPLVPVYRGGLRRAYSAWIVDGFRKRPRQIPCPVTIRMGKPMKRVADTDQVYQAVQQLRE